MIDIILDEDRKLKDIQQIGRPEGSGKIYMEADVYERIHADKQQEKAVYVLMGHTKREEENYVTFVDGVIAAREIIFSGSLPIWNNRVWNDVYDEIRQDYENEVIVGWVVDMKGASPRLTAELEAVHREQFGGVHQLLLLMDSLEQEEYFYQMRGGHLVQRGGFYIYYRERPKALMPPEKILEERCAERSPESVEEAPKPLRYREWMAKENEKEEAPREHVSGMAVAAAVLLLIGIIGTGIYQNRIEIPGIEHMMETFFASDAPQADAAEILLPE